MEQRLEDVRMSIGEHLEELRRRLFYSLISFFAVFLVTFYFHGPLRREALRPLDQSLEHLKTIVAAKRAEPGYKPHTKKLKIASLPFVVEKTDAAGAKQYEDFKFPNDWRILKTNETGEKSYEPAVAPFEIEVVDETQVDMRPMVLSPQEGVFQDLKLAMLIALLFAAPILLYQIWAFIRAGLYDSERRAIGPYLPLIILLFLMGVAFGYFLMLPLILRQLETWLPIDEVNIQNRLQEYLSLFYTFTFWLGMIFEVPVVMMILARIGFVSARGFLKAWRWAVLGGVIAGAILNPAPDIMTQMLFAAPIVGLYLIGCLLAFFAESSRKRATERRLER
ncbi:MAG: twin-arginine translocase subunit TatC [Planctomycetes bacterium]|nr:twin-arginine translocase subunit TatC [Planctomycetota bacterium]